MLPPCLICKRLHLTMSSRSRRVAAEAWKAGDVAWVKYEAGPARGTLDKRLGEMTWNVSFDDGEETQIPERLLLREEPAATPTRRGQDLRGAALNEARAGGDAGDARTRKTRRVGRQSGRQSDRRRRLRRPPGQASSPSSSTSSWFSGRRSAAACIRGNGRRAQRHGTARRGAAERGKEAGILGANSWPWPSGATSAATSTRETRRDGQVRAGQARAQGRGAGVDRGLARGPAHVRRWRWTAGAATS